MKRDVHTFTHGAVHTGTYCTLTAFNMLKKKKVYDMKINHISGIKFITAFKIIQNITVFTIHPKPSHSVRKFEKPRVPVCRTPNTTDSSLSYLIDQFTVWMFFYPQRPVFSSYLKAKTKMFTTCDTKRTKIQKTGSAPLLPSVLKSGTTWQSLKVQQKYLR